MDILYDKDAYLILNNVFENPIKFDNANMVDVFKRADNENLNIMLRSYADALNGALKSEYFESKNKDIKINNRKVKAKADKIIKDMSKSLQNNKKIIKTFKEISGDSESGTEKYFKDIKVNDKFNSTNVRLV